MAAGVDHYALGYAASGAAVDELRPLLRRGPGARPDRQPRGVWNRGRRSSRPPTRLSSARPPRRRAPDRAGPVPPDGIAREAAAAGTPVWVTTGRSGPSAGPTATVAEANDIVNLLLDGVSGLVLTGESAVGSDPGGAVERVAERSTA